MTRDESTTDTDTESYRRSRVATLRDVVRVKYHLIRVTVRRDVAALGTVPGGQWLAVGAAVVLAAAVGALQFGVEGTYAESVVFLVLALLLGLLGWTVGMVLVVLYAVFDLAVSFGYVPVETLLGRLISYAVLYGLVVLIPSAQRTIYLTVLRRDPMPQARRQQWKVAATATSAVVTGGLVYLWATVAPFLLRPMFAYPVGQVSSATARSLTISRRVSVLTLQSNELLLAVAAVGSVLLVSIGYQWRAGVVHIPHGLGSGTILRGRFLWLGRVLRYGLVLLVLAGLVTDILDVVLLVGALAVTDVLLLGLARVRIVRDLLVRVPWLLRLLAAFVLTFVATQAIVEWRYQSFGGSEFFPFVLSLAIGVLVFRLFLDIDEAALEYRASKLEADDQRLVPILFLVALVTWVSLATVPDVALADDCSGLSDCVTVAGAAVSAAFAAMVAAVWYMLKGVFAPMPPVVGQLEPLLSEEGADAQRGAYDILREKAMKDYWNETGDTEGYLQMKEMSLDEIREFVNERQGARGSSVGGFSTWGRGG